MQERTCIICQKKFTPNSGPQMCCSHDCYLEKRRQKRQKKKVCPVCEKSYWPNSNNQVYCSNECSNSNRRITRKNIPKECKTCRKSFLAARDDQQYCSSQCYGQSMAGVNRSPAKSIQICPICDKHFSGKKRNTYCSRACKGKASQNRITKECRQCGKSFEISLSKNPRKHYCCAQCGYEFRQDRVEIVCQNCQKSFTVQRWYAENGRIHCTKKCADEALRNRVTCTCDTCGNEFERTPSQIEGKENVYCSVECSSIGQRVSWTDEQLRQMRNHDIPYGHYWREIANRIRERDDYTCQLCGLRQTSPALHVHHKKPLSTFLLSELEIADHPDNLIALCPSCHKKVEYNPSLISSCQSSVRIQQLALPL